MLPFPWHSIPTALVKLCLCCWKLSVCPFHSLSVTLRYCANMTKQQIEILSPPCALSHSICFDVSELVALWWRYFQTCPYKNKPRFLSKKPPKTTEAFFNYWRDYTSQFLIPRHGEMLVANISIATVKLYVEIMHQMPLLFIFLSYSGNSLRPFSLQSGL